MMKIILVSIGSSIRYNHGGIDSLIGYFRKESMPVDVTYFHRNESAEEIIEQLSDEYDVYGFSPYITNIEKCLGVINVIKEKNPKAIIILGGVFSNTYYKELIQLSHIDYIIMGDGEIPLTYLFKCLQRGETVQHSSIVSKNDIENKVRYRNYEINWSPALDYFTHYHVDENGIKSFCIQTKNNICTGHCSFCQELSGKLVFKPISKIINEILAVYKLGVNKIYFADDNLFDPGNAEAKDRVYEICEELIKREIKCTCVAFIRADNLKDCDEDNALLEIMRKAGFYSLFIGVEAGNEEDLRLYRKRTSVEENKNIIKLLKKHDIIPKIGFINFNPYSTLETLRKNYEFLTEIENDRLYPYTQSFVQLYPGTALYQKTKEDGYLLEDGGYLKGYNFAHEEILPIVEFIKEYLRPRLRKIQLDSDWAIELVEINKFKIPEKKYNATLNKLRNSQKEDFEIIRDYFYFLYVKNDVEKCKSLSANFISYFERKETYLQDILLDLGLFSDRKLIR